EVRLPGPPVRLRARAGRGSARRFADRRILIIGVGIDVVPVARFAESLERTPSLASRLFTAAELVTASGAPRTPESLAARFAAKEALAKSLGAGGGMAWTDAEVQVDEVGRPSLA